MILTINFKVKAGMKVKLVSALTTQLRLLLSTFCVAENAFQ